MKILPDDIKYLLKNYTSLKQNKMFPVLTGIIEEKLKSTDETTKNIIYAVYFKKETLIKYSIDNYLSQSQLSRKLRVFRDEVYYEFYKKGLFKEIKRALVYLKKIC